MSGANPLIRGLALRIMTSIRVPEIIHLQLMAVRKCSTDTSPYVRKCVATALIKVYKSDPEGQLDNVKHILEVLLKDSSTMVTIKLCIMTLYGHIHNTRYIYI